MLHLFYVTCRGVSGAKSYILTQDQFFKLFYVIFREYIDYLVGTGSYMHYDILLQSLRTWTVTGRVTISKSVLPKCSTDCFVDFDKTECQNIENWMCSLS